jgi:hypothetical protein
MTAPIPDPADRATIMRIQAQFGLDFETAYRSQTCRRLATVRTRFGRRYTGSLTQHGGGGFGWVRTVDGSSHFGRVIANHGTVWPDGRHESERDGEVSGAPYEPPPADWVYIA